MHIYRFDLTLMHARTHVCMHTCMYVLTRRGYSLIFLLSVPLSDLIWFCFGGSWYWLVSEPELHSILLLTFAQGLFLLLLGWLLFCLFLR